LSLTAANEETSAAQTRSSWDITACTTETKNCFCIYGNYACKRISCWRNTGFKGM